MPIQFSQPTIWNFWVSRVDMRRRTQSHHSATIFSMWLILIVFDSEKPRMLSEKNFVVPLGITSNLMRLHQLTHKYTYTYTQTARTFVQAECWCWQRLLVMMLIRLLVLMLLLLRLLLVLLHRTNVLYISIDRLTNRKRFDYKFNDFTIIKFKSEFSMKKKRCHFLHTLG